MGGAGGNRRRERRHRRCRAPRRRGRSRCERADGEERRTPAGRRGRGRGSALSSTTSRGSPYRNRGGASEAKRGANEAKRGVTSEATRGASESFTDRSAAPRTGRDDPRRERRISLVGVREVASDTTRFANEPREKETMPRRRRRRLRLASRSFSRRGEATRCDDVYTSEAKRLVEASVTLVPVEYDTRPSAVQFAAIFFAGFSPAASAAARRLSLANTHACSSTHSPAANVCPAQISSSPSPAHDAAAGATSTSPSPATRPPALSIHPR